MRRCSVIILLLLAVIGSRQSIAAGPEWKLEFDKDGIQVYTRDAPGCPLNEFKGVTTINASMQTISAVLRDVSVQSDWMADCLKSKLLQTISPDRLICYNVLHVDWPLSDRDLIIDVKFTENRNMKKCIADMAVYTQDILPVNSKYVRIRDFKASCTIEEISPGLCRVVYQNRVNPMAPVPDFLANRIVKKNPYNTLKGMKKMAAMQKYQVTAK